MWDDAAPGAGNCPSPGLRHENHAGQVRVDHIPPAPAVDFQEGRVVVDSGVVDQDVDAPPALGRTGDGLVDLGLVGHVTRVQPGPATVGDDLTNRALQVGDRAAEHEHVGAL